MSNKNNEMIPANTGFLALADFNMNEGMAEELVLSVRIRPARLRQSITTTGLPW